MYLKCKKYVYFCSSQAQMAESVDALVSNTSGFTSMPVRSRLWVQGKPDREICQAFFVTIYLLLPHLNRSDLSKL